MKFIEQQLVAVLTETPHETECSLSAALLKSIGLSEPLVQGIWLEQHRPAKDGKTWHEIGEHWEYSSKPSHVPALEPISLPPGLNWRTSPTASERMHQPIVVRPLRPLAKTA